mmetsp:Transcript_40845/g.79937  ORF Transcript_40845/g.79937 Transcript_40845/m.79937 type:complete len:146 (+) Transcript_40845:149-586(+)
MTQRVEIDATLILVTTTITFIVEAAEVEFVEALIVGKEVDSKEVVGSDVDSAEVDGTEVDGAEVDGAEVGGRELAKDDDIEGVDVDSTEVEHILPGEPRNICSDSFPAVSHMRQRLKDTAPQNILSIDDAVFTSHLDRSPLKEEV